MTLHPETYLTVEHVDVAIADLAAGEVDEVDTEVVQRPKSDGEVPVALALGELELMLTTSSNIRWMYGLVLVCEKPPHIHFAAAAASVLHDSGGDRRVEVEPVHLGEGAAPAGTSRAAGASRSGTGVIGHHRRARKTSPSASGLDLGNFRLERDHTSLADLEQR